MAIRMKEWGMLAAPRQPVNLRTQGLMGWGRVGRAFGQGLADVVEGAGKLHEEVEKVQRAGELAAFTSALKGISAEVGNELKEQDVRDWDYSWNAAFTPRMNEALQRLSPDSRASALEMARLYSTQASIEARRDRDTKRISDARGHWEEQLESSISAGQEEQAARWVTAARGVFVPEDELEERVAEARSRACQSRMQARLQAAPLETLAEVAAAEKEGQLPIRPQEARLLEQNCTRARQALRRELAASFSDSLRAGVEPDPATLELAARAGIIPDAPRRTESAASEGSEAATAEGEGKSPAAPPTSPLPPAARSGWRRWLDSRAEGEESELSTRLAIAAAPLPLAERRALLERLELTQQVPAADRRTFSNRLFSLCNSGAFGCPGDAEAQRSLLALQEEGATLLAEQGAEAVAQWLETRAAGAADSWVCFEAEESHPHK